MFHSQNPNQNSIPQNHSLHPQHLKNQTNSDENVVKHQAEAAFTTFGVSLLDASNSNGLKEDEVQKGNQTALLVNTPLLQSAVFVANSASQNLLNSKADTPPLTESRSDVPGTCQQQNTLSSGQQPIPSPQLGTGVNDLVNNHHTPGQITASSSPRQNLAQIFQQNQNAQGLSDQAPNELNVSQNPQNQADSFQGPPATKCFDDTRTRNKQAIEDQEIAGRAISADYQTLQSQSESLQNLQRQASFGLGGLQNSQTMAHGATKLPLNPVKALNPQQQQRAIYQNPQNLLLPPYQYANFNQFQNVPTQGVSQAEAQYLHQLLLNQQNQRMQEVPHLNIPLMQSLAWLKQHQQSDQHQNSAQTHKNLSQSQSNVQPERLQDSHAKLGNQVYVIPQQSLFQSNMSYQQRPQPYPFPGMSQQYPTQFYPMNLQCQPRQNFGAGPNSTFSSGNNNLNAFLSHVAAQSHQNQIGHPVPFNLPHYQANPIQTQTLPFNQSLFLAQQQRSGKNVQSENVSPFQGSPKGDQTQQSQKSSLKEKAKLLAQQIDECRRVRRLTTHIVPLRPESKTFEGIPSSWHQTIKVRNPETMRVKLYFKCRHSGCGSIFKKSCNLRDHFRKHTGQRPFTCPKCRKTFTQSGNLGRHLKNVHGVPRESISFYKRQGKTQGQESNIQSIEQWDKKNEVDDTISDSNFEGSLVLMTCAEFEQKYPDVAESYHESSQASQQMNIHSKIKLSKPFAPSKAADSKRNDPEEEKEDIALESDEVDDIDDSSSYRV